MTSPRSDINAVVHEANVEEMRQAYTRQFLAGDLTVEALRDRLLELGKVAALGPRGQGTN